MRRRHGDRDTYEISDLLAPLYAQSDGSYRHEEPAVLVLKPAAPAPPRELEQVFMVVDTDQGQRVIIVWSFEQMQRVDEDYHVILEIGYGVRLPTTDDRQPIMLGGDYPRLFQNLDEFVGQYPNLHQEWNLPNALHIALSPSHQDEPYGFLGGKWSSGDSAKPDYRLYLYPDKQQGRELLRDIATEDPHLRRQVAQTLPYLERCVLPETTDLPVVTLGPRTAWWVAWWYRLYAETTHQIH